MDNKEEEESSTDPKMMVLFLLEDHGKHKQIFQSKLNSALTSRLKHEMCQEVTDETNERIPAVKLLMYSLSFCSGIPSSSSSLMLLFVDCEIMFHKLFKFYGVGP